MPKRILVAEQNNSDFTLVNDTLSSTPGFSVLGIARAGTSNSGVGIWFQGTYGEILINNDGTFTYRLNNLDPDTQLLAAGRIAEERFTYTYSTGGGPQQDSITIEITGVDEPAQQVSNGSNPIIFTADATIMALQQLWMGPEAVRFTPDENYHSILTNEGAIYSEAAVSGYFGVALEAGLPWNGSATLLNLGLIEQHSSERPSAMAVGVASTPEYDNAIIVNHGVIRGISDIAETTFSRAITVTGQHVVNTGTIEAISNGEVTAVWLTYFGQLDNDGYIYAEGATPEFVRGTIGVWIRQGHRAEINNSGTIHAVSHTAIESVGIAMFRDSTNHYAFGRVNNSGTIVADIAVQAYGTSVGGITGLHLYNSGHVEGAFDMDLGLNILFNQAGGEWIGAVRGGYNEDAVRNRGWIDGAITLGDGRDLFDGRGGLQSGTVSAGAGDDTLLGGNGADNLAGDDGSDYIVGGGGADSLTGGGGGDVFAYHSAGDSTSASADTIADFQTGIDRLDLGALAPSSVSLTASGGITTVTANTAGGTVTISVSGTIAMSDILTASYGAVRNGTGAAETLFAHAAGSQLNGLGGDDVLEGSAGADRLDGGTGWDLMRGGDGNDVYLADDYADLIVEFDGEGVDELRTSASQRLQGYVENLTMLGSGDIFATGNDLDNVIVCNSGWNEVYSERGDDVLIGGGGADRLYGGEGKDTFVYLAATDSISAARDTLILFDTGEDRIDLTAVTPTSISIQETMLGYWQAFAITNIVTVETAAGTMTIKVEGKLFRSDFILGDEIVGTAAAESVTGTVDDDVVIGGAGDDILTGLDGADTMSGQEGNDRLIGGAGADIMTGGFGNDVYLVDDSTDYVWEGWREGYDVAVTSVSYKLAQQVSIERLETADENGTAAIDLTGNTFDNLILGNDGDNILDGGQDDDPQVFTLGGFDTLVGNGGDDVLIVDGSEDIVVEAVGGGHDTVIARYSYVLTAGAYVELMMADQAGIEPLDLTGNTFGQTLRGNSAVNNLDGLGGADTFLFAAVSDSTSANTDRIRNFVSGVDKIDLSAVAPTSVSWTQQTDPNDNSAYKLVSVQTAAGAMSIRVYGNLALSDFILTSTITGTPSSDVLAGTPVDDTMFGLAGNDFLDGGPGADSMAGGTGNDTYVVDNAGDAVTEAAGAGTDTVRTAISFSLGANLENLTLTGASSINGTGNTLVNLLTGNGASNILNGGAGADTMQGAGGNDTYIVDNAGDRTVEAVAADGTDTVQSSVTFTLTSHVENLVLTGAATINGNGSVFANNLTGNDQANTLDGAGGADSMVGGLGNDTYIVDNAGDLVTEAAAAGTDLVRSALSHTLAANVENLVLTGATSTNGTGNGLANSITGNSGANVLDGGAGADTMNGGAGNDNYIVDDSLDRVSETSALNGTDTVQASVDYVLGANIENLILLGSAINGTGNALANSLTGNSAANTLNGFSGADIMRGYGGDDTYIVDNAGDIVGETPGNGADTVRASLSYTLAPNVENLILTGTVAINGTGNAQNNAMTGNIAANVLKGGFGNDTLSGGDGNDTLFGDGGNDLMTGGAGADRFTFQDSLGAGNADHVADFAAGSDKIMLENAVFSTLAAGGLSAGTFVVGTAAADANDRIIYDAATGNLFYDSDGSGAGAALLFATLDNTPATLAASDFLVI